MNIRTIASLAGLACIAFSLIGCCQTGRPPLSPRGVINPPDAAGVVVTGLVLVDGIPFKTNQNLLMRSNDTSGRDYDLLAGPYPANAGDIDVTIHHSAPTALVSGDAFSYVIGKMPITRSKRVIAGSAGTEYVLKVSDATSTDLVCVLQAYATSPVVCTLVDPATGKSMGISLSVGQGQYVKVSTNGQGMPFFAAAAPIPQTGQPDPDGVIPFLAYVTQQAQYANLQKLKPQSSP